MNLTIEIPPYEHPDFLGTITRRDGEAEVKTAREKHDLEHAVNLKATAELTSLAAERAKLNQRQAELERKSAAEMDAVQKYNSLVKDLDRQRKVLELARGRFEILKASIASRIEYLHENCWSSFDEDLTGSGHPLTIQKWYSLLAGSKLAVADFPNFEIAQVAKIEALEATVAAFAEKHGINAQ